MHEPSALASVSRIAREACGACITRHIGPALDRLLDSVGADYCGGCGQTVERNRFAYWFPFPTEVEA